MTLKCQSTPKNYGGYYESKIGIITADEMVLAGIPFDSVVMGADESNYLNSAGYWWSMTPYSSTTTSAVIIYRGSNILSTVYPVTTTRPVRPVINLRSDIKVISGNGTASNPYVVSL